MPKPATDPVFIAEEEHLHTTYDTLVSMETALESQLAAIRAEASDDKNTLADELATNFASEGEAQETYVEYANINTVVESYNRLQESTTDKLERIAILKKQPYFAKLELEFSPNKPPKELYLGNVGVSDESYRRLVVDWRSPVAEVYYNQSNGPTSYKANGRTINVTLKLRRQFDIEGNQLNAYFDTTVAIQDELLLASLSKAKSDHMQAITTTIQKEQNVVIRHEDVPALLVSGVAGSGKTSVLLQRIAYLFYQKRETLDPREVVLVTPNPVFRRYIDNVLPSMGERNPLIVTAEEFMASLVPQGRTLHHLHAPLDNTTAITQVVTIDDLRSIDENIAHLEFMPKDFRGITSSGQTLITAQTIARINDKFSKYPAGYRRIALMIEELEKRLTSRLGQMASTEEAQNEVLMLTPNEQVATFGELAVMEEEESAKEYTLRFLKMKHAEAFNTVRNCNWLRVDRIGKRLLGKENLPFLEWAYLKIACTGIGNRHAKYVMIDEVQDYSAAQLAVMARYFSRAHFLLLGDENQAITPNTASFDEVRGVFEHTRGEVYECQLATSYRSTPAITELFSGLATTRNNMTISSVQRESAAPTIAAYDTEETWAAALRAAVSNIPHEGTCAIVCANEHEVERVQAALTLHTTSATNEPASTNVPEILPITSTESLPPSGIVLITLTLAKGLEFDHVVVPNANAELFPQTTLARRRLYTTISRATKTVAILSCGPLTPLLR